MNDVFSKIDRIRPFYDWTYRIVLTICKLLLVGDILITSFFGSWALCFFYPGSSVDGRDRSDSHVLYGSTFGSSGDKKKVAYPDDGVRSVPSRYRGEGA